MKTSKLFIFVISSGVLTAAHAADSKSPTAAAPAVRGRVSETISQETIQRIESLAPAKPTAVPAKPRKVMIFCSVTGWRPPAIALVNKTVEILGQKTGAFEVTAVSEDASIFTPEKLAEFDAIVMNNCNELHISEERSRRCRISSRTARVSSGWAARSRSSTGPRRRR